MRDPGIIAPHERRRYGRALKNTLIYTGSCMAIILPLATLLACVLKSLRRRIRSVVTFILMIPGFCPPMVLGILFLLFFYGRDGFLNHWLLRPLGVDPVDWLMNPEFIMPALIMQGVWRWTGILAFFLLIGLDSIPRVYYEAARLDGASVLARFRGITLPMMRNVLIFTGLYIVIDSLVMFAGSYVLLAAQAEPPMRGYCLCPIHTRCSLLAAGDVQPPSASASPPFCLPSSHTCSGESERPRGRHERYLKNSRRYFLVALILGPPLLASLLPLIWMAFGCFKTNAEIFRPQHILPASWDFTYLSQLFVGDWIQPSFIRLYLNSILYAGFQAAAATATSLAAAYCLVFASFRGRFGILFIALALLLIPPQMSMAPLARWMTMLHLHDTALAVILPGAVSGLGILFFTLTMHQIPREYVDMARCEGAGETRSFLTLLPLLKPAIFAFFALHFVLSWNDHVLPSIMLHSPEKTTVTIAISRLLEPSSHVPYALLMASSVLYDRADAPSDGLRIPPSPFCRIRPSGSLT